MTVWQQSSDGLTAEQLLTMFNNRNLQVPTDLLGKHVHVRCTVGFIMFGALYLCDFIAQPKKN